MRRRSPLCLALVSLFLASAAPVAAQDRCLHPCVGPHHGSLVLAGGGNLDADILRRFVELAGGPDAPIVVIPTASSDDSFGPMWPGLEPLRAAGATRVRILHTRDPRVADSEAFVSPLREARGVWIPGGRPWRLVDAYLGTRTEEELHRVLERGGVIGGSSAGASIMASYLVRGGTEGNHILMAPGYEEGFGFLRRAAVDQHLIARQRVADLLEVLYRHPHLLGIGLDEGTAIVVTRDRAEVVGRSRVAVYDPGGTGPVFVWLSPGDSYDLGERRVHLRAQDAGGRGPGG